MTRRPRPRGTLVAIGGNEDKSRDSKVLRRIASLPEGGTTIVEVIPTASEIPEEVGKAYIDAFDKVGITKVRVMDIRTREEARREEYVRRIEECDVVFLTGGDQLRLTSLLGGSPLLDSVTDHYWNGGVVAGTSAGAAAMSGTMIAEGDVPSSMIKGNVQMVPGLALIRRAVIDTHFIQRGRVSRLLEVIASNPEAIGIGLGEDTGVIIREGELVEVIGTGVVVIVDGQFLRYSNIAKAKIGEPIGLENMVIHTLVEGSRYHLSEHRYEPPPSKSSATNGAASSVEVKR